LMIAGQRRIETVCTPRERTEKMVERIVLHYDNHQVLDGGARN
jgi:hypothetical protein